MPRQIFQPEIVRKHKAKSNILLRKGKHLRSVLRVRLSFVKAAETRFDEKNSRWRVGPLSKTVSNERSQVDRRQEELTGISPA